MSSRPRRSRGAAVALAVLVVASAALTTTASADVAALRVDEPNDPNRASTVHVTVTTSAGAVRRLGPFALERAPEALLAAPDGRHALLLPDSGGTDGGGAFVLPLDGSGGPVPLAMPKDVTIGFPYSQVSWTPDSTAVVIGDALRSVQRPEEDPDDVQEDEFDTSWTALSCPVATAVCGELPGPAGSAVGVPGGALISSSIVSLLPLDFLFEGLNTPPPAWSSPTSVRGRLLRSIDGDVRVSATHVEGTTPKLVARKEGPFSAGLPYTWGIVGGPSGALLKRYGLRTRIETRRGRIRLRETSSGPRLVRVAPDGAATTTAVPRIRIAARDQPAPVRGRRKAQDQRVIPVLGRADGGWLGVAKEDPEPYDTTGSTLVAIDAVGRAAPVRIGGRPATATRIVDALPGVTPLGVSYVTVVGYEPATRRAVVSLEWRERRPGSKRTLEREEEIRVRVDGRGRPQQVRGGADTAW